MPAHMLWIPLVYAVMSLVTIIAYWMDKRAAQRGRWRVPERRLHLFELLGGWPGGLIARRLVRHKTQKSGFRAISWTIIVIHLTVLGLLIVRTRA